MIPYEAVDAAAKVMFAQSYVGEGMAWEDVAADYSKLMRASLEAAAPHMLAAAWDEGHEEGFWNGRLSAGTLPSEPGQMPAIGVEHAKLTNPYKKDGTK